MGPLPMISEEQWAAVKPRFNQLYRVEDRTLQETMCILNGEGFHATQRMYKTQIRKWKLQKHNNDKVLLHLLRKHDEFQRAGKVKAFRIRRRPITAYAARRHFERKSVSIDSEVFDRTVPSPTPSALSIISAEDECTRTTSTNSLEDDSLTEKPFLDSKPVSSHYIDNFSCLAQPASHKGCGTGYEEAPSLRSIRLNGIFEDVLFNIRDLCTITTKTIRASDRTSLSPANLQSIYFSLDSVTSHLRKQRFVQALAAYDQVQTVCSRMFATSDPWLLATVVHSIFEFLSDPRTNVTTLAFLRYMSQLASAVSICHPMTGLIDAVLNGSLESSLIVDTLFRSCADLLGCQVGSCYEVCFCINRIRAFALVHYGLYDDAEKVLTRDLADIGRTYGAKSRFNLSRLFSLAGCLYGMGDLKGALCQVYQILRLLPDDEKSPTSGLTANVKQSVAKPRSQHEYAMTAASRLKLWLVEVGPVAHHIIHAEELVTWLQDGAPLPT